MYQKQTGASMWQWLFIGGMVAVFLYAGLQLFPVYMEAMSVRKALASVESSNTPASMTAVRKKVASHFQIDRVDSIRAKDLKFKNLRNGKLQVSAEYDKKVHMVGNLFLLVEVRETIKL